MEEALSHTEKMQVRLEKAAEARFGERGLDLAINLFLDNPDLSEAEFWMICETEFGPRQ